MESFNGAEICELVGLYMLNILVKRFGRNYIGIYRDDGLAVIPYANGPKIERARKDIIRIFSNNGLKITAECNLSITDFLDVTFNLNNGTYCPYKKTGTSLLYINKKSNHPPSIIKNLPNNIVKRVSDLSSNSEQFNKAKNTYQKALIQSGYRTNFNFEKTITGNNTLGIENRKSKNRRRNITWFNPPFSANVSTNVW